jgi:hypothetical protein
MVAGLDVGGTKTNATLLDSKGVFLNNRMVEAPSRVLEGPEAAIEAMAKAIELAIGGAGVHWESVRVIGLDTPGPASANGVISSKGGTNFSGKECGGSISGPRSKISSNYRWSTTTTPMPPLFLMIAAGFPVFANQVGRPNLASEWPIISRLVLHQQ